MFIEKWRKIKGWNKEKVKGLKFRNRIAVADQFKSLPSDWKVKAGDIPSLVDFDINQTAKMSQV